MHEKYRRRANAASGQLASTGKPSASNDRGRHETLDVPSEPEPYRRRSHSTARSRHTKMTDRSERLSIHHDGKSELSVDLHPHLEDADDADSFAESEDEREQDIDEVWFAGGHADIGGGWEMLQDSKSASHVPLVWMVHEAIKAGLHFDIDKLREMGCLEALHGTEQAPPQMQGQCNGESQDRHTGPEEKAEERPPVPGIVLRTSSMSTPKPVKQPSFSDPSDSSRANGHDEKAEPHGWSETFHDMMHKAHVALIHDSLEFDCGLSKGSVLAWKIME